MTFYNLPETDVTVEYDKKLNQLTVANLPGHFEQAVNQDSVLVTWAPPADN